MQPFLAVCSLVVVITSSSPGDTPRTDAAPLVDSIHSPAVDQTAPAADLVRRMGSDRCVLASFAQLLRGAFSGEVEVAAFVVNDERSLACRVWPRVARYRSQTFKGQMPPETLAIVHTHPGTEEEPSENDIKEAARLRLPFFVLTPFAIWVTDAGAQAEKLRGNDWLIGLPRRLPDDCSRVSMAH